MIKSQVVEYLTRSIVSASHLIQGVVNFNPTSAEHNVYVVNFSEYCDRTIVSDFTFTIDGRL